MTAMTSAARVDVEYGGGSRGPGPLTFAQANVLSWVSADTDEWSAVIPVIHPVDGAAPVDRVAAAIGTIIERYDSLRTNYLRQHDEAVQAVRGGGELFVDVHENVDGDKWFPGRLARQMRAMPFDLTHELPLRAAVNELLGTGRAFADGEDLVGFFADSDLAPRAAHLTALAGLRSRPTAIARTR